jgi:hypothetical protein
MAHIVPFKTATARRAGEGDTCSAEGAQIVIFPGVRRERHAEPRTDLPSDPRDPNRDWLDLPDELSTASP